MALADTLGLPYTIAEPDRTSQFQFGQNCQDMRLCVFVTHLSSGGAADLLGAPFRAPPRPWARREHSARLLESPLGQPWALRVTLSAPGHIESRRYPPRGLSKDGVRNAARRRQGRTVAWKPSKIGTPRGVSEVELGRGYRREP